ncbi:hypothetical protein LEP1GSC017_3667 [Leptospira meyeri serovar Hardjo str. Went 5]|nr:hypothetical protein [Leptospira meyeri]EKJ85310.1 hypothetical protein LEP1GSC017_3667 [Leptospira meyeri serovar Hardjo str. Went 5]
MNTIRKPNLNSDPTSNKVEVFFKGNRIIGKIYIRTKRDLAVRILFPFKNFTAGLHKPYFSNPDFSYLDNEGIEYAKSLLIELYKDLYLLENKSKIISDEFPKLRREITSIKELIYECENQLNTENAKIKSKKYTPNDYQRRIKLIKSNMKEFQAEIWKLETDFFEKIINVKITYTLREEYLIYLEEKLF